MERIIEGTILEIEPKTVTRKRDGQKITLYDVKTSVGTYTAGRRDIAEQAYGMRGQSVLLNVKEEQNGTYVNRYLQSVSPNPVLPEVKQAMMSQPTVTPTTTTTHDYIQADADARQQKKDESIHRQVATKVAAWLQPGTPNEFWQNVDELIRFYETGEKPTSGFDQATAASAADDDIPF